MAKLLHCPFCGSKADDYGEDECGCPSPSKDCIMTGIYSHEEWNSRAEDPRLKKVIRVIERFQRRSPAYTNDRWECGKSYALTKVLQTIRKCIPKE